MRIFNLYLWILPLTLLASVSATATDLPPAPTDTLITFTIPDQFDTEHTEAEFAGKVMLFMWGDREGSDHMRRWGKQLIKKLRNDIEAGQVGMRSVAHVQGAPSFIHGMIKGRFPKEPEKWALMDWDGLFKQHYGMLDDHCNLIVFDSAGRLIYRTAVTKLKQDVLDEVLAAVRSGIEQNEAPGEPGAPINLDTD